MAGRIWRAFTAVVAYLGGIAKDIGVTSAAPRSLYEERGRDENHRP